MIKNQPEEKGPRVIKRYRNRKLYDTSESCYVTLEDIADMIRTGLDITVIDNNTQEDLTSVCFAQIILEEERKKKDYLSLGTLTQLIRSGGETIKGFVQKSFTGGFKEIDQVKGFYESKIKPTLENVQNIPSVQSEMKNLRKRIEELESKLNSSQKGRRK